MANEQGRKIVGLGIGTGKVAAVVGKVRQGVERGAIGIGSHRSRGLKNGVVVKVESAVQSIRRAVEEAELVVGGEMESVYACIACSHVYGMNFARLRRPDCGRRTSRRAL